MFNQKMKYSLLPGIILFCVVTLKAQNNCTQTLTLSRESINRIFAALQDQSIRGTSVESQSAGFTEWYSTFCIEGQQKEANVYSSSNSDGVKFTFLENGKEKEANKLFDRFGELLQTEKPLGWFDKLEEYTITKNVYYFLRDNDTNKTKEVRLKLEETSGKYSVFIWFDAYH